LSPAFGDAPFVDSSVVVRYLVGQPVDMAERARKIIDDEPALTLSELAILESAFVLNKTYGIDRQSTVRALSDLVQRRNIHTLQVTKAYLLEALDLCRPSGRVSFGDALLWAEAVSAGTGRIFTFDRRFPDRGITLAD